MPKYTKQKLLEFQKELEAEKTKLADEKRQLQEHGSQILKESQEPEAKVKYKKKQVVPVKQGNFRIGLQTLAEMTQYPE